MCVDRPGRVARAPEVEQPLAQRGQTGEVRRLADQLRHAQVEVGRPEERGHLTEHQPQPLVALVHPAIALGHVDRDTDDPGHGLVVLLQRADEVLQFPAVRVDGREHRARPVEGARDQLALGGRLGAEVVVEVEPHQPVVGETATARDDAVARPEAEVAVEHPDGRGDGLQHRIQLGPGRGRVATDKCHECQFTATAIFSRMGTG